MSPRVFPVCTDVPCCPRTRSRVAAPARPMRAACSVARAGSRVCTLLAMMALTALPAQALCEEEPGSPIPVPELSLGGYYRVRPSYIRNLYLGERRTTDLGLPPEDRAMYPDPVERRLDATEELGYIEHRLRLEPRLRCGEELSLNLDLDLLDGVIWGDNAGFSSISLFAGSPSNTARDRASVDDIFLRRAWMEFRLPVGLVRIGRMPSHFGMGLLSNDGDGLEEEFGEKRYGSTMDRVLFATRPGAILDALFGRPSTPSRLVLALAYDKIVDHNPGEPVLDLSDPKEEEDFVLDLDDCTDCAPLAHLASSGDDVDEWVLVLYYKDEEASIIREKDLVAGGAYLARRSQTRSDSVVYILDLHLKLRLDVLALEAEVLTIQGQTSAIKQGRLEKEVSIWGGAARGGYEGQRLSVLLKGGYASGDQEPFDEEFTGRSLHPAHRVGLLLYGEVLAERTARAWTTEARGFWSNGGVYNSFYLMPMLKWRPWDNIELIAAFLWARADEDTKVVHAGMGDASPSDLDLGYELDGAIKIRFLNRMHWSIEGGVLFPGRALWVDRNGNGMIDDADAADRAFTLQSRIAMEF